MTTALLALALLLPLAEPPKKCTGRTSYPACTTCSRCRHRKAQHLRSRSRTTTMNEPNHGTKVTCPYCHRSGTAKRIIPEGTKIKCPACGETYQYQASYALEEPPAPPPSPPPPSSPPITPPDLPNPPSVPKRGTPRPGSPLPEVC